MSKKQDKTRELELKITDKKVIDAIINLKLGEERERERIMKIIDDRMEHYDLKLDTKAQVALESVKQEIKGDEK